MNDQIVRSAHRFYMQAGGVGRAILAGVRYYRRSRKLVAKIEEGTDIFDIRAGIRPGRNWYPLENFFGETFRWVWKNAQIILRVADDSPRSLMLEIEPGPGVKYKPFELLLVNQKKEVVARTLVRHLQQVELAVPVRAGEDQLFYLTLEGGNAPAIDDQRVLNFRLFSCRWSKPGGEILIADDTEGFSTEAPEEIQPPVFLHTNGCGDFTLMAREHWFDVRGYPEFDMFSMNLDSVLCYAAHHAGFREEILRDPLRIYHIEHASGSGWTPEGQVQLFARLAAQGLATLDYHELVSWASQMRRLNRPMIFNVENWGLADAQLEEIVVDTHPRARAMG